MSGIGFGQQPPAKVAAPEERTPTSCKLVLGKQISRLQPQHSNPDLRLDALVGMVMHNLVQIIVSKEEIGFASPLGAITFSSDSDIHIFYSPHPQLVGEPLELFAGCEYQAGRREHDPAMPQAVNPAAPGKRALDLQKSAQEEV